MSDIYKSSKEEYVAKKGLSRIGQLNWWFLVLIVIGIIALAIIWFLKGGEVVGELQKGAALLMPISTAYAGPAVELAENEFTPKDLVMAGIFLVLGIVYIAGIFKLFFSDNSNQIDTASDLVKTLTGFFVGAATGHLG